MTLDMLKEAVMSKGMGLGDVANHEMTGGISKGDPIQISIIRMSPIT